MRNSYIYTITNITNGKIYVGSTVQKPEKRFTNHKYLLDIKKHRNKHLQNAWNLDGKHSFKFEILEEYPEDYRLGMEHWWINTLNVCNREFGYNLLAYPENPPVYKRTTEQREEQSKRMKGKNKNNKNLLNWIKKNGHVDNRISIIGIHKVTGSTLTFNSIKEAAKYINGTVSCISECIKGEKGRTQHLGYIWKKQEIKKTNNN